MKQADTQPQKLTKKEGHNMNQFKNYQELMNLNQQEFNNFPHFCAFTNQQFDEGMKKLGVEQEEDICRVTRFTFIRKTDYTDFINLIEKHQARKVEAFNNDEFLKEAIICELKNYEYLYTYDEEPALEALGFSLQDLEANERLKKLLKEATQKLEEEDDEEDEW